MPDLYLDSLREEIEHTKRRLGDLQSGRVTFYEIAERGRVDTTAEEIADNKRRISVLESVLAAWINLDTKT